MEPEEIFDAWAPYGGAWSPWVKPVLFAFLPRPPVEPPQRLFPTQVIPAPNERQALVEFVPRPPVEPPQRLFPTQGIPAPHERQALVVELPGPSAVTAGLALSEQGYRPVPLFNACPPPWTEFGLAPAAVDVDAVLAALVNGAERLRTLAQALAVDAPPAFLVDADRQTPRIPFQPGVFDNRSILFPTDFPSAVHLASQSITGVVLIRERDRSIAWDLARVLRDWRRGGLGLRAWHLDLPGPPTPLVLPRWWFLTEWGKRLWASLALKPNPMGGYGGLVTEASGG